MALSAAITEAEKKTGQLTLTIWRPDAGPAKGREMTVRLDLPVKGAYSKTAPWNCPKTELLIDEAAQAILKNGFFYTNSNGTRVMNDKEVPMALNVLALLATGEEKYITDEVRQYVRGRAGEAANLDYAVYNKGISSWYGGYRNLMLTEYYLHTGDEKVLPGIKALSKYLAYGQSGVGTWSHGMAPWRKNDGLYGPPDAYGAMNQCSLTCALSLALAQKCGVPTKAVNDAVNRSKTFYTYYVDKGTIPYGDNEPAQNHDNNGRNSQAAVFFDILGDEAATKYFSRMTLASYNVREIGHTGHFFSWAWGALGASRGGPGAALAFMQNTRWFHELERRPDDSYVYQYQLRRDHFKYQQWDTTGSRLLALCLPRKQLYITGKKASCIKPFTRDEVEEIVSATTFQPKKLSTKELLAALGSWSILVRESAARELGEREDDVVDALIAMLDSPNRFARYGACTGLRFAGRKSKKAVDAMAARIEKDDDTSMRFFAVQGLTIPAVGGSNALGWTVTQAGPALLRLAATYEPERDPRRKISGQIAETLLYDGNVRDYRGYFKRQKDIEKIDKALLIPALKAWLRNPHGGVRGSASRLYSTLSDKDLEALWGDIYVATKYGSISGSMFAGEVQVKGLNLIAKHKFEEGLPMALDYLYRDGWGKMGRVPAALDTLAYYGSKLKPHLEEMRKEYKMWVTPEHGGVRPKKKGNVGGVKEAWDKIQANLDKDVQLKSLKPYLEGADITPPERISPEEADALEKTITE